MPVQNFDDGRLTTPVPPMESNDGGDSAKEKAPDAAAGAKDQLDHGEIDPFELDDIIHRHKRAAQKLWSFCGSSGAGWERAANALAFMRENGESHDWWDAARPKRQ